MRRSRGLGDVYKRQTKALGLTPSGNAAGAKKGSTMNSEKPTI
jgi:hypothetical protein